MEEYFELKKRLFEMCFILLCEGYLHTVSVHWYIFNLGYGQLAACILYCNYFFFIYLSYLSVLFIPILLMDGNFQNSNCSNIIYIYIAATNMKTFYCHNWKILLMIYEKLLTLWFLLSSSFIIFYHWSSTSHFIFDLLSSSSALRLSTSKIFHDLRCYVILRNKLRVYSDPSLRRVMKMQNLLDKNHNHH